MHTKEEKNKEVKNTSSARPETRSALPRRNRVSKLSPSYSFIQSKKPKLGSSPSPSVTFDQTL